MLQTPQKQALFGPNINERKLEGRKGRAKTKKQNPKHAPSASFEASKGVSQGEKNKEL
jgi:hypothetical protein